MGGCPAAPLRSPPHSSSGTPAKDDTIFPGKRTAPLIASGCRKSCCSRPKSRPSCPITGASWSASRMCARRRPLCSRCPLAEKCIARRTGRQHELPAPRLARARHRRRVFMVVALRDDGSVLLERRPESGVWGGLWCLPEFSSATAAGAFVRASLGEAAVEPRTLGRLEHAFTHFALSITPRLVRCRGAARAVEEGGGLWYNVRAPSRIGLPTPITALLSRLADESLFDAARA